MTTFLLRCSDENHHSGCFIVVEAKKYATLTAIINILRDNQAVIVTLEQEMSFWRNFRHWLQRKLSIMTTSGAAGDENFVKMTIFPIQWSCSLSVCIITVAWLWWGESPTWKALHRETSWQCMKSILNVWNLYSMYEIYTQCMKSILNVWNLC